MKKLTLLLSITISTIAYSGPGSAWNWGEKETEAKGNWMNMEKKVKQKKYNQATSQVTWLLKNTPELNVALYINAIKVYEKRAAKERNTAVKVTLQDSVLWLYQQRLDIFGDSAKVLNRKGRIAWKYLSKRKNQSDSLFTLYAKIHELNGEKTYPENMSAFMKAACTQYVNKKISKSNILEIYQTCNDTYDAQEQQNTSAKKLKKVTRHRQLTNEVFTKNVDINCEDIQNQFGEKFEMKQDLKTAQLIVRISVSNKCVSNPVFIRAGEYLVANEKSNYALQKIIANVYLKKEETQKAKEAFAKGIELSEDSIKKAKLQFEIAKISALEKNFVVAREQANQVLAYDPSFLKAHAFIGDLYFQSSTTCSTGNKVQDRSIYIAAYNKYVQGGDLKSANLAKAQFPSTEEMFLYNQKVGDAVNTGCWIGEKVKLASR